MIFSIVESFSPEAGDRWTKYCAWRGMVFQRFDSIDALLRPRLFMLQSTADCNHMVRHSGLFGVETIYLLDLEYALVARQAIGQGDVIGLEFEAHDELDRRFLGYDLIDGYERVSLLTNWGNSNARINAALAPNALVPKFETIAAIRRELLEADGDDAHVEGCRIVSIYAVRGRAPA